MGIFSLLTRTLNKYNNKEKGQHPPPLIMLRNIVYFNGESLVSYQFNFIQLRYLLSFLANQEWILSFPPLFYQNHFLLCAWRIFSSMLSTCVIDSLKEKKKKKNQSLMGNSFVPIQLCTYAFSFMRPDY